MSLADADLRLQPVGVIAFEATDGLFIVNAAGGTPRKIRGTLPGDGDPAWSPDGTRIAFDREIADNRDVYVMNADGTGVRRLTFAPGSDAWPEWSADGRTLAFVSRRDGYRSIYAIELRTGAARRVARYGQFPDWTPDRRIIFTGTSPGGERGVVLTVRPYGFQRRPLPTQPGDVLAANVSPDGTTIVYQTIDEFDIYTAAIDGSGARRVVASGPGEANDADWSPDGAWLVYDFPAGTKYRSDVFVIRTDGTERRRITRLEYACCAEWSEAATPLAP